VPAHFVSKARPYVGTPAALNPSAWPPRITVHVFHDAVFVGLGVALTAVFLTWLWSLRRHNVAVVDSVWGLLFALMAFVYSRGAQAMPRRAWWVLALVTVWALRLSIHLTLRNWEHDEDRRYRAIRARNEPYFAFKSLYLVFAQRACLAWIISLPLIGAITSVARPNVLDWCGAVLCLFGMLFEATADRQLSLFTADGANRDQVMARGLWRYSRHPNYFGDFCF
jgi:steroid 5-alpha reductase family enzyme